MKIHSKLVATILFLPKTFLIDAFVSAELSIYFLSKNKDKFEPPHKSFHNSHFVLVRTRL